jgi:hypothetical protein
MVTTPIDPIRIPTITLSQSELTEVQEEIEAGILPPDYLDRHYEAVARNVFGFDAKKIVRGNTLSRA